MSSRSRELIEEVLRSKRNRLLEHEALALVEQYGVRVPRYGLARSEEEAIAIAEKIGYPVVLKIVSPEIIHKSDVGGVVVGLEDSSSVRRAYRAMLSNIEKNVPGAEIVGVLVQKMAEKGAVEVIIGGLRDPVFGPAVMFGLGGVFVEVFKDVSFRVAPFDRNEAYEMIREVKAYRILRGYRGQKPRSLEAIVETIMAVQKIMVENPEIKELDLNPVLSYPDRALVVDARVLLSTSSKKD